MPSSDRPVGERAHDRPERRFALANDHGVDERIGQRLLGQQTGVDAAPDDRHVGLKRLGELARGQRVQNLRTGHARHAEAHGPIGESLPEPGFPVRVGELIDDRDLGAVVDERRGGAEHAQRQFDAAMCLEAAAGSRIEQHRRSSRTYPSGCARSIGPCGPDAGHCPTSDGVNASNSAGASRCRGDRCANANAPTTGASDEHRHAARPGDERRQGAEPRRVHARGPAAEFEQHGRLFQARVARAIAEAVHRHVEAARAAGDGGQGVRRGQAQVVVPMKEHGHRQPRDARLEMRSRAANGSVLPFVS